MKSFVKYGLLAMFLVGITAAMSFAVDGIAEIPDRSMVSKGGVLYPFTGDSSQARFQTPPNYKDFIPMGALIGVLPEDCIQTSKGQAGLYYQCDHGLAMMPEVLQDGRQVYRVIEQP